MQQQQQHSSCNNKINWGKTYKFRQLIKKAYTVGKKKNKNTNWKLNQKREKKGKQKKKILIKIIKNTFHIINKIAKAL